MKNYITFMQGQKHINAIRSYCDYLEEHLNNVKKAFNIISEICKDMWWVVDDYEWHTLRKEIEYHDISKFSPEEFIQYCTYFYIPQLIKKGEFSSAWTHHKQENTHHHESIKNMRDVVHMIVDWYAMSLKFGDTPRKYYENNSKTINLSDDEKTLMFEIFDKMGW